MLTYHTELREAAVAVGRPELDAAIFETKINSAKLYSYFTIKN
ncbi:hypothetical protein [Oceanobacillus neutriphilus]|uniref:Uncharacterized protein n=1 Tax=Oceanobacillus neutriphilus TaxID=531815 RepID=A0ABQ2NWM5_9BACI|nr:hypothetical protein [Oceanobacillus neutriphilus]GGP12347.1 hypothetical protein GCM10011346_27950 [Oceanobacillus neutriphilus]